MKDVVSIRKASRGTSLKFLISPSVQEALSLEIGDNVQVFIKVIPEDNQQAPLTPRPMVGTIIKAGGTSKGVTIKKDLVKLLQLEADQIIEIDIEKANQS